MKTLLLTLGYLMLNWVTGD